MDAIYPIAISDLLFCGVGVEDQRGEDYGCSVLDEETSGSSFLALRKGLAR